MQVKDIWNQLTELTGSCDSDTNYSALGLGLEWLVNEKLYDPLVGYVEFNVSNGYTIALPREVKTPLKLTIDHNPSFHRNRFYEFAINTDGTMEGETADWTWSNRGYSVVQDERHFPAKVKYVTTNVNDNGKTLVITYKDSGGVRRRETLTGNDTDPGKTQFLVASVDSIVRQETMAEVFLMTEFDEAVARYYPDERQPEYRVIKLSKTSVGIVMMFRRHVPATFTTQEDVIPFHSRLAIIHAAKCAMLLQKGNYEEGAKAAVAAREFAKIEQESRSEDDALGSDDVSTARQTNISTIDSLICADLYDDAAEIFGNAGRQKLFDQLSIAREVLAKKSNWDAATGSVDLWKSDTSQAQTVHGKGHGIYVLPRFVGAVCAVNVDTTKNMPRNRWFEFHMNGTLEREVSDQKTWDEMDDVVVINPLPVDKDSRHIIPVRVAAVPENAIDDGARIRIYGFERLIDGREVEVYRDGERGWLCPCRAATNVPANDCPSFVRFTDIDRDETRGFVSLYGYTESTSFGIVGDAGKDNNTSAGVAAMIKGRDPDHVILLGDNNYPDGSEETIDETIGKKWRPYIYPWLGNSIEAPLGTDEVDATHNRCWPVAGNHDWTDEIPGIDSEVVTDYPNALPNPSFPSPDPSWSGAQAANYPTPADVTPPGIVAQTTWTVETSKNYIFRFHYDVQVVGAWKINVYDENGVWLESVDVMPSGGSALGGFTFGTILFTNIYAYGQDEFQFRLVRTYQQEVPASLAPHLHYFSLPSNERYYTRVFGSAQFFFLSSEPEEPDGRTVGSIQYQWLVAALAQSTAKWKIAVMHRTPLSSGTTHGGSATMYAWDFPALGIDVVLAGHEHNYERLYENGVYYVVAGTGPDNLYPFGAPIASSQVRIMVNGGLFMQVTANTLHFEFRDVSGTLLDQFTITKGEPVPEILLGYWYPDEKRPHYRRIKVWKEAAARIRIRYKLRTLRINSLFAPMHLRSAIALIEMMRSLKSRKDNNAAQADLQEQNAVRFLNEQEGGDNPTENLRLQFHSAVMPGGFENVQ